MQLSQLLVTYWQVPDSCMELDVEVFIEAICRLSWNVLPGQSVSNWDAFFWDVYDLLVILL